MTERISWRLLGTLAFSACGDVTPGPGPVPGPGPEPVPLGQFRVTVTGAIAFSGTWSGYGNHTDLMAADTGEQSRLFGESRTGADSVVGIFFPGRLSVGVHTLVNWVPGGDRVHATAALAVRLPAGGVDVYAGLAGGTLNIDSAGYPARPGLEPGATRGTLTMRAVRVQLGAGGVTTATADTITLNAQFHGHWYHYLRPNVRLTLAGGGPVSGTSSDAQAEASNDSQGGLLVYWNVDFDGAPGPIYPFEVSHDFRLVGPRVGTFSLANATPAQWHDPYQWPPVFSGLYFRDDPRLGLSTGGTLTVTRYVAPTLEFYGEIAGTMTTRIALWTDMTTPSADSVDANVTFNVQLWPLGGVPGAAAQALEYAPFSRDER